jgi:two-component system chemotaxis response regulator CheB
MSHHPATSGPIRVLIADDSAFMRCALTAMVQSDPALAVVGTAVDGLAALEQVQRLKPDVVLLDVEMPRLNGLQTLRRLMRTHPRPVIMVSGHTQPGSDLVLDCLEAGAFDCIAKPMPTGGLDISQMGEELLVRIKAAGVYRPPVRMPSTAMAPEVPNARQAAQVAAIIIGASTGGPLALREIVPSLPLELPVPVVVVQHMLSGFTSSLAARLDHASRVSVREAAAGDILRPATVYVAPVGQHLTFLRRSPDVCSIVLSETPAAQHRPSIDIAMLSAAEVFGNSAMGVILTGMGDDGSRGMKAIHDAGGWTLGQDQVSCAVYGMPRVCAKMGVLRRVVPLEEIASEMVRALGLPLAARAAALR